MTPLLETFVEQASFDAVRNGKSFDAWKREFAESLATLIVLECATVVDSLTEESYGVANRWATGADIQSHFLGK